MAVFTASPVFPDFSGMATGYGMCFEQWHFLFSLVLNDEQSCAVRFYVSIPKHRKYRMPAIQKPIFC
jgi:hypothetical protein